MLVLLNDVMRFMFIGTVDGWCIIYANGVKRELIKINIISPHKDYVESHVS